MSSKNLEVLKEGSLVNPAANASGIMNRVYVCDYEVSVCIYVYTTVGSIHSKKNGSTSDKDNPANIVHNASSHSNGDKNAYLGIFVSRFLSNYVCMGVCMYVCMYGVRFLVVHIYYQVNLLVIIVCMYVCLNV